MTFVQKGLERRGITAHVEPHFQTAAGLRKPDLIVEMEGSELMIDAQVVSEQVDLDGANRRKASKYDTAELKDLVRIRYGKQEVTIAAVTIRIQGIWRSHQLQFY